MTNSDLSLRKTALTLEIDLSRLLQLGRYLGVSSGEACIPAGVVTRAALEQDENRRYRVILEWLLSRRSSVEQMNDNDQFSVSDAPG